MIRDSDDGIMIDTFPLSCTDLQPSPNWKLETEDPLVYVREDTQGYNPSRQWPNTPYPKVPPPQPDQPGPQPAPTFDLRKPMALHHLIAEWCLALGEDPCKDFRNKGVQHQLEAIQPKEKECPVCHKKLSNTQRLKAHVRAAHMEETPYYCSICKRYFADKHTMNLHNQRHSTSTPLFVCQTCQKPFTQKSRLTEHEKIHQDGATDLPCQYCQKIIKEKKNLLQHEQNCKSNVNRAPRKQCPYCVKNYQQKKDLAHHVRVHHASRLNTWQADFEAAAAAP